MTLSVFDPKLAICFAIVVRENSITGAARSLGVAQPWVSEQVRKLEMQIGERLLIRTSRRMQMTEAGRRFLPLAEGLCQANELAQRYAADARARADREVRIGATDFTIGLEERVALIDHVGLRMPRAELQITGGKASDLIALLHAQELDVALVHISSSINTTGLQVIRLGPRYAHLMVLPDDPLASFDVVPLAALSGRQVAVSPGRSDATARNATLEPLRKFNVEFISAPDEDRQSIATFAARHRMLSFWYYRQQHKRHMRLPQLCLPIEGQPLQTELAVYCRLADTRTRIQRFWSATEELAQHLKGEN